VRAGPAQSVLYFGSDRAALRRAAAAAYEGSMLAFHMIINVTVQATNALFLLSGNYQRSSVVQVHSETVKYGN